MLTLPWGSSIDWKTLLRLTHNASVLRSRRTTMLQKFWTSVDRSKEYNWHEKWPSNRMFNAMVQTIDTGKLYIIISETSHECTMKQSVQKQPFNGPSFLFTNVTAFKWLIWHACPTFFYKYKLVGLRNNSVDRIVRSRPIMKPNAIDRAMKFFTTAMHRILKFQVVFARIYAHWNSNVSAKYSIKTTRSTLCCRTNAPRIQFITYLHLNKKKFRDL